MGSKPTPEPMKEEARIQAACVEWFRYQFPRYASLLFAVANGGSRNPIEAKNLKAQGVTPGVADLILLVPSGRYHGACIELKSEKGRMSTAQMQWLKSAGEQGYYVTACWGFDEFVEVIHEYFSQNG